MKDLENLQNDNNNSKKFDKSSRSENTSIGSISKTNTLIKDNKINNKRLKKIFHFFILILTILFIFIIILFIVFFIISYHKIQKELIKIKNTQNDYILKIKNELKEYIKDNIKFELQKEINRYLKDDIKNEVEKYFDYNLTKKIEIDINEIKNEIKNEVKTYNNKLFNDNSKNYIKVNDTINAQKLQNKIIGNNPGNIVDVQNNGKIYPNIIFTKGMIMAWFGQKDQIPETWAICNGTNGTLDLRNRFIIGSSENIPFCQKGGNFNATLSKENLPKFGKSFFSCDSHQGQYHQRSNGFITFYSYYSVNSPTLNSYNYNYWGSNYMIDLDSGFNSSSFDITNPYFSLYYIMKL